MQALFIFCLLIGFCSSNVIVSEIMYNPRQGNDFQFIEFYNTDSSSVDMTGWVVTTDKISFTFPSASIGGTSFLILANKRDQFLFAYPSVPSSIVFGDLQGGSLGKSATITVKNPNGETVLEFEYKDSYRPLSNGFGPSLELICFDASANFSDKSAWVASSVYTITDPLLEYSGSPNAVGSWYSCPPPKGDGIMSEIVISEIMYKPLKEKSKEDQHEWLEIYNPNSNTVSLDGYRIIGKKGLRFAFPKGSIIGANSYAVIAKNPSAFSNVYGTNGINVFGGFTNGLANGGDEIAMINSNGQIDDRIEYDNKWPFPIAADAQSAGEQYKGLSIERVSLKIDGDKTYNWVASTPTPGAANRAARDTPFPIVTDITIFQNGAEAKSKLAPSVSTTINAKISPKGTFSNAVLEYYVDILERGDESVSTASMTANDDGTYSYTFADGFAPKTILRYRVKADFDSRTGQVISHRSNDPVQWHGIYFSVAGALATNSDVYELMITQTNWTEMWTNMKTETRYRLYLDDPNSGNCCMPNPTWNTQSYAVLAYKGKVYDVGVKYQGSNYNRMNGNLITRFDGSPLPTQPDPLRQLSLSIELAEYDSKIDGKDKLIIQKSKDEGCSFHTGFAMYELARQLGIPAPYVKFSQVYINGGYYLYGMDLDYYTNDMMERFIADHNAKKCRDQPTPEVGLMFKAGGFGCKDGYNALANFQYVPPSSGCGFDVSTNERLSEAYNLETQNSWGTVDRIANLTYAMGQYSPNHYTFTDPPNAEAKAFLEANFDVNMVLNYLALVNFAGAYDDLTLNYMVYVRGDGKTQMGVWDMDELLGGNPMPCGDPKCTLFAGEEGAPVSQWQVEGAFNNLKNAFIKTFRNELIERYRVLSRTVLSVDNVNAALQMAQDSINVDEFDNDPAWTESGNIRGGCLNQFKSWANQRSEYIQSSQGEPTNGLSYNTCPDVPASTRYVSTYQAAPGTPTAPMYSSGTISWRAPNSNGAEITSYNLQRSTNNGKDFSTIYSGSDMSYVDSSSSGVSLYRVQAVNSMGESQFSSSRSSNGDIIPTTPTTGSASSTASVSTSSNDNGSSSTILFSIYTIISMIILFA